MASSSNPLSPPHFNGENYHVWAVKMRAYLRALGVWQYVEENRVPPLLRQNPTLNQIRQHEDEVAKAPKALSYIHVAVSDSVFTRIMACESAHEAWMKLKTEFQGEAEKDDEVLLKHCIGAEQTADIFTKALQKQRTCGWQCLATSFAATTWVIMPNAYKTRWMLEAILAIGAGSMITVFIYPGVQLFRHWLRKLKWKKQRGKKSRIVAVNRQLKLQPSKTLITKQIQLNPVLFNNQSDSSNSDVESAKSLGYHTYKW
ncbi:hypothetical protein GH714_035566 [Hevea brasiliensis]|uniref:Uncharacterized protein n=1 Tax=Hevea brasiliensis TaxID=3981 RepID=A0A6A6NEF5_HEVBR|nr:hypothetical protein GH714_035566 [Hevea brasiliensis]